MSAFDLNNVLSKAATPDQIKQACVLIFEQEHEKGRAYIDSNKAPRFESRRAFARYYVLSEHLRVTNEEVYKQLKRFLIRHWYAEDQKI